MIAAGGSASNSVTSTRPRDVRWFRTQRNNRPEAPTFLLIHGVGLSHRAFSRLARELAPRANVIAPDLPGFGYSSNPGHRMEIADYAAAIDASLGDSGPVVVVGHSLGVQVAIEFAQRRPDVVRGVVLIGAVVDPRAPTALGQGLRLARDVLGEPPLTNLMVARDYLRGGPLSFFAGVASMLRYSTAREISRVTVPLLVLRGEGDPIAPADWSEWLAAQLPHGRMQQIPAARHNVCHSDPCTVADALLEIAGRS